MLRASSISLIVATSLTLSVCLQPGQTAGDSELIAQKSPVKTGADAKKDTTTKDAKPKTPDKGTAKDSKDSKDSKDGKDSKSDGKVETKAEVKDEPEKEIVLTNVSNVTIDQLIEKPKEYLGKNVRFTGDFASFCTLALNYKPAFRPQKTHISFLVRKPDSKVPMSELKLALPIPKETDKTKNKLLTSLRDGDKLEMTGKVFSTALEEPWVDVVNLKRLSEAKKPVGEDKEDEE
ncbi:MAG: hypothetical protein SGJ27_07095 [Candidatus Melainabacteria bacterium]|nr:hypothetical protein [Candidatus Melainabacteria bacterium]